MAELSRRALGMPTFLDRPANRYTSAGSETSAFGGVKTSVTSANKFAFAGGTGILTPDRRPRQSTSSCAPARLSPLTVEPPGAGAPRAAAVSITTSRRHRESVSRFRQRATVPLPVAGAAELREGRAGQPSAVSLGPRTGHDARRDSSPCAFDFPIQPFAPTYGTSFTAGAALPTRSTMTRSRSSSLTLLPSARGAASFTSTLRPGEHVTRVSSWSSSTDPSGSRLSSTPSRAPASQRLPVRAQTRSCLEG
jgi:hypothetical protein